MFTITVPCNTGDTIYYVDKNGVHKIFVCSIRTLTTLNSEYINSDNSTKYQLFAQEDSGKIFEVLEGHFNDIAFIGDDAEKRANERFEELYAKT